MSYQITRYILAHMPCFRRPGHICFLQSDFMEILIILHWSAVLLTKSLDMLYRVLLQSYDDIDDNNIESQQLTT